MESTYYKPGAFQRAMHGLIKRYHLWFRDERMIVQCAICFEPRAIKRPPEGAVDGE